ncbi:hypothetical protein DMB66_41670, partial [Actinoplanes sp. ATCC 53533]
MRSRTRLICTSGLLLAALIAATLPWWPSTGDRPPAHGEGAAPGSVQFRDEAAALAEARRSKQDVLIDTDTTATSQTWALPDGQRRTRTHAVPQRAKDSQGRWAPVDLKLTSAKDAPGGLTVRPGNPATPV